MAEVWNPPALDDITTSELVTAAYLNGLGNSLRFLKEPGYAQITADVNVTATTEGTANTVVALSSLTYEAVPHLLKFFSSRVAAPAGGIFRLAFFDGSTQMGLIANIGVSERLGGVFAHRFTPTAAAHTYSVRGYMSAASTGVVNAGAGGTGVTYLPAWIRVTRIPT